mgnify:CR=1 FL=1
MDAPTRIALTIFLMDKSRHSIGMQSFSKVMRRVVIALAVFREYDSILCFLMVRYTRANVTNTPRPCGGPGQNQKALPPEICT